MISICRIERSSIVASLLAFAFAVPSGAPLGAQPTPESVPSSTAASIPPSTPASSAAPKSGPTAVVVAVDTSRSLSREALQAAFDDIGRALLALPAETPTGLLAFDDGPRWIVQPGASPKAIAERLRELEPQGSYTLLHDALFAAADALPAGGVVLLATDGRDENSATTVDDIARRYEAQKVRVVAVGTGRSVEEKALRRFALLTRGDYVGKAGAVEPERVVQAVDAASRAIAAQQAEARQAQAAARPAPEPVRTVAQPVAPVSSPEPSRGSDWSTLLPWLAVLVLGLSFLLFALGRSRAARRAQQLEEERQRSQEEALISDEAEAVTLRLELAQTPAAAPRESPEVTVDTAVLQRVTLEERLDRTRVLSSMLILRKPGEAPRSFLLDRDKAFAVGRDREKNTLSLPDPSISAQHFKVVPRGGVYYFVDLESTNGSYVGGRRVRAKRLRSGDVIRAGQVDFEFQSYGE
jgi:hypothetical protein